MGIRGELFSTKVQFKNRTYFFNVKENRMGDLYLNIVESKNKEPGDFERQSIVLFADDLQDFLKGFDESLRVLEKSVREKKRAGPKMFPQRGEDDRRPGRTGEKQSDEKRKVFHAHPQRGENDRRPGRTGEKQPSENREHKKRKVLHTRPKRERSAD
ncbi:MAG: DUF3276 family protein [Spirochaetaceae bacterium]|jgi:hypothetical protein|nr:DUF3276 family protein [Spirochaetaceae bacterium]